MLTSTKNFHVAIRDDGSAVLTGGDTTDPIPPAYQDNAQLVLDWLQAARDYLGRPILVTNLYRSAAHNAVIPGHASNSQHLQALGADFDVIGMSNHEAVAEIQAGQSAGAIPAAHQVITYLTDHHVHVGVAGGEWGADNEYLLETAVGVYEPLTVERLASLTGSAEEKARNAVGQIGDVATTPIGKVAAAFVTLYFIAPAFLGGRWV